MRNTLILLGQIRHNEKEGLAPFGAVVEATVQRSRPVILTALFGSWRSFRSPKSVFWGTLAHTLIGGTFGGTVLTLVFLPALYAIWFKSIWRQATGRSFLRFMWSLRRVNRRSRQVPAVRSRERRRHPAAGMLDSPFDHRAQHRAQVFPFRSELILEAWWMIAVTP
jgi:hypothetical protein